MALIRLKTAVPGPKSAALMARRAACTPPGFAALHPVFVESASGSTVTDVDGNTFLDFTGGIGVMNVGHSDPRVVKAITEQAARLQHTCMYVLGYESYIQVAEALVRLAPGTFEKRAFLVSTGAEAVENAVKIARRHTGRGGVLCFEHAFHGRTLLGMSLTGKAMPYKAGFGPFAPEVYRLPYPYTYRDGAPKSLEASLKPIVHAKDLAAVIIEPVLGEGGFVPAPAAYLEEIRSFCDDHGIVMIADEVQTGFGRTGKMFACESLGVIPDLTTVAKSIAAGMPLAGVVGRASVMDSVHPGGLGGTYAGNPIACAAAVETIAILEKEIAAGRPEAVGRRLNEFLLKLQKDVPRIGDVRGIGPMQAIELVNDRSTKEPATKETAAVVSAAREKGLLLLSAGTFSNVIRFLAPVTIPDAALDEGLAIVGEILRKA